MKKAAKWLLCINLLAWTLLAVQVLTVNMEQRVAQNMVPVQNGDVQAKGEDADAVKKKVALTFDDDVIIGLSQEISYKEAVSMI